MHTRTPAPGTLDDLRRVATEAPPGDPWRYHAWWQANVDRVLAALQAPADEAVPADDDAWLALLAPVLDRLANVTEGLAPHTEAVARAVATWAPRFEGRRACAVLRADAAVRRLRGEASVAHLATAALARHEAELGPDDVDTARMRHAAALAAAHEGRFAEALSRVTTAAAVLVATLGADHLDAFQATGDRAWITALAALGPEAVAQRASGVALARAHAEASAKHPSLGPTHPSTLVVRTNVAFLLTGDAAAEATDIAEDVLEVLSGADHLGADSVHAAFAHTVVGDALGAQGQDEAAIRPFEAALAIRERPDRLGPIHPRTRAVRARLARQLRNVGRHEAAVALHRVPVEHALATHGVDHPDTRATRLDLAGALFTAGELDAAEAELVSLVGAWPGGSSTDAVLWRRAHGLPGRVRMMSADFEGAIAALRVAVDGLRGDADPADAAGTWRSALAFALHATGRHDEAIQQLEQVNARPELLDAEDRGALARTLAEAKREAERTRSTEGLRKDLVRLGGIVGALHLLLLLAIVLATCG